MQRSEADLVAGVLRFKFRDGPEVVVPTLTIAEARSWNTKVVNAGIGLYSQNADAPAQIVATLGKLPTMATDTMLDLITEYDRLGALGDRDHMERRLDAAQLYAVLKQMLEASFIPFVGDLGRVLAVIVQGGAAMSPASPSTPPESTNGLSPTGASIPAG